MTDPRIEAARTAFEDNSSLAGATVYVSDDNFVFAREADASARAKDVSGDRTDYYDVSEDDIDIVDDIDDATDNAGVDTAIDDNEKGWLLALGDEKKREIAMIAGIADVDSIYILNVLKAAETNQAVIDEIDTRIAALD
jgi:hypothetical protein